MDIYKLTNMRLECRDYRKLFGDCDRYRRWYVKIKLWCNRGGTPKLVSKAKFVQSRLPFICVCARKVVHVVSRLEFGEINIFVVCKIWYLCLSDLNVSLGSTAILCFVWHARLLELEVGRERRLQKAGYLATLKVLVKTRCVYSCGNYLAESDYIAWWPYTAV